MPTVTVPDGASGDLTGVPVGSLMAWALATPPQGWLVCDGQQVPIATYPALYAVITVGGTLFPFGANTDGSGGSGSSHFRLPDLTGRFVRMAGQSVDEGAIAHGSTGGANTHAHSITTALTAAWTELDGDHAHSYNTVTPQSTFLTTGGGGDHGHGVSTVNVGAANSLTNLYRTSGNISTASGDHAHGGSATGNTSNSGNHAHSTWIVGNLQGGSHYHTANVTNAASSTTHNSTNDVGHAPVHARLIYVVCAVPA